MIPLEKLPEVTDNVLSGLTADETLKQKIYSAALHPDLAAFRFSRQRIVTVSCCLALAAVLPSGEFIPACVNKTKRKCPSRLFLPLRIRLLLPFFCRNFSLPDLSGSCLF